MFHALGAATLKDRSPRNKSRLDADRRTVDCDDKVARLVVADQLYMKLICDNNVFYEFKKLFIVFLNNENVRMDTSFVLID